MEQDSEIYVDLSIKLIRKLNSYNSLFKSNTEQIKTLFNFENEHNKINKTEKQKQLKKLSRILSKGLNVNDNGVKIIIYMLNNQNFEIKKLLKCLND